MPFLLVVVVLFLQHPVLVLVFRVQLTCHLLSPATYCQLAAATGFIYYNSQG
jgi:hypothetical protein